jgi:hypothetical protein
MGASAVPLLSASLLICRMTSTCAWISETESEIPSEWNSCIVYT